MAQMQSITRAGTTPHGKSKILFVAHRDEIHRYVGEVSEDILKITNCAIWYDPDPRILFIDDFYTNLFEMQLLVICVTQRMLDDFAGNGKTQLHYAMENHIPILPLLQDISLVDRYGSIFGDIQFLCKQDPDPTALPFDRKLEQFLSSVLISDELTEKIRSEFDAQIFLSYRKKDRRHAVELMRQIHDVSFCRDIAIWYDEYLIPGEHFNESIRQAIESSSLFALAVTPNLVNEENYIEQEEYPFALKRGKPMVAFELTRTDRTMLFTRYAGIPEPVDVKDPNAFTDSLQTVMRDIAVRENDHSPEHNFHIGLAYLFGIDVEVDRERAHSLILSAAEDGYIPAIEKLIAMYTNGNGVQRDYKAAASWQYKLYTLEAGTADGDDEDSIYKRIYYAGELADGLYKLRSIHEAFDVYQNALELCGKLPPGKQQDNTFVWIYDRIGTIYMELRQYANAEHYIRMQLQIAEKLLESSDDLNTMCQYATACQRIAMIREELKDFREAESFYQKGLETAETVLTRGINEFGAYHEALYLMSLLCNKLGFLKEISGDLQGAKELYLKSLEYSIVTEQIAKNEQSARDLMISYQHLGDICCKLDELDDAEEYYQKMMEIQINLSKGSDTPETRRDLAVAYCKLGVICEIRSDHDRALFFYNGDLEISQALAGELGTPESYSDAAVSCENLTRISLAAGNRADAKKYLRLKLEYDEKYAFAVQTLEGYHALGKSYLEYAQYCQGQERLELLEEAADIWDQLSQLFPNDPALPAWAAHARKLMQQ